MGASLLLSLFIVAASASARDVATFSIVARDPVTEEIGVAVERLSPTRVIGAALLVAGLALIRWR